MPQIVRLTRSVNFSDRILTSHFDKWLWYHPLNLEHGTEFSAGLVELMFFTEDLW
jgi:hypothetical protein